MEIVWVILSPLSGFSEHDDGAAQQGEDGGSKVFKF